MADLAAFVEEHCPCRQGGDGGHDPDVYVECRRATELAEALAAHVREQIARDIEAAMVRNIGGHPYSDADRGMQRAARIARGGAS